MTQIVSSSVTELFPPSLIMLLVSNVVTEEVIPSIPSIKTDPQVVAKRDNCIRNWLGILLPHSTHYLAESEIFEGLDRRRSRESPLLPSNPIPYRQASPLAAPQT